MEWSAAELKKVGNKIVKDESKGRTGVEIGVVVVVMIFMGTLTFNAGITYGQQVDMRNAIKTNDARISALDTRLERQSAAAAVSNSATAERLARIETLMSDIKEELDKANK